MMYHSFKEKQAILIVDDSDLNRELLAEILSDQYEIIQAPGGNEAVSLLESDPTAYDLVLLDLVMPEMDGFAVLDHMQQHHWTDTVPVIIISSEMNPAIINRTFEMGATDYISRPFDAGIVRHRVKNTITLYTKQRRMAYMLADQIYSREKRNQMMISILSHIVESRNGESGLHVLHIGIITEILLRKLLEHTDRYNLTREDVEMIVTASALHDVGKITISKAILNKTGKLTPEEYEVMKSHTTAGAEMLQEVAKTYTDPLVQKAYEICRWHHERYDGRGYPDGLKGEAIPIGAQVVALADVYDALVSERCYKKSFPHEVAVQMIVNGECGAFNPLLLDIFLEVGTQLQEALKANPIDAEEQRVLRHMAEEIETFESLDVPMNILRQLELEQEEIHFLTAQLPGICVRYTQNPSTMAFLYHDDKKELLPVYVVDPYHNKEFQKSPNIEVWRDILKKAQETTLEHPYFSSIYRMQHEGKPSTLQVEGHAVWLSGKEREFGGYIIQVYPVAGAQMQLDERFF